jgi:predicted Zn-dependent protease
MTQKPQEITEMALQVAKGRPGMLDCVAIVSCSSEANLRWANSTLTTNGSNRCTGLCVVVFLDVPGGVATGWAGLDSPSFDPTVLLGLLLQAESMATATGPSPEYSPLAQNVVVGDFDGNPVHTTPDIFAGVSPELGRLFLDKRTAYFGYAAHTTVTTYAQSLGGHRIRLDEPHGYLELNGRRGNTSAWVGRPGREFLFDVAELEDEISTKLGWQERQRELPAGRYPVILEPGAVADMLCYLADSLAGREAFEGRSVFSKPGGTKLGEQLSPATLDLYSDPHEPGLECPDVLLDVYSSSIRSPFDIGQRIPRVDWIKEGVLSNLETTRAIGSKIGVPYAPGANNIVLRVPGASGESRELVKGVERGLLITCLWYIREVDPETLLLTGLTRDGVYVIEDGEVVGATGNFRFNESPVGMLSRIRAVGESRWAQPRECAEEVSMAVMPPLLIDDFNLSSVAASQ